MNEGIGVLEIFNYLRQKKSLFVIAIVLALGVCLMLFGGGDGVGSQSTAGLEKRVEVLCERIDGVSGVSVMIVSGADGGVRGVAVVCTGGDSAGVKLKLTQMITALFCIPSSSVSIVGGK